MSQSDHPPTGGSRYPFRPLGPGPHGPRVLQPGHYTASPAPGPRGIPRPVAAWRPEFAAGAPSAGGGAASPHAAQPLRRPLAGLLAGALATVAAALGYGVMLRALAADDGSYREFGYPALAVGLAVGVATGRIGGRHRLLPYAAPLLAAAGVVLGEVFGLALISSHISGGAASVTDLLLHRSAAVLRAWRSEFDPMSAVFYAVAALAGLLTARHAAR